MEVEREVVPDVGVLELHHEAVAEDLAVAVVKACRQPAQFAHLYELSWPIRKKIETIATKMYGAGGVAFEPEAERQMDMAEALGFGQLPVCMAKTPLSLSHDPALKGRPTGFTVPIKELRILAGAGFVTEAQAAAWVAALTKASEAGEFYGSVTYYAVLLRAA